MAEIVVIGAGPAGLMAALRGAQSGHRCTVVEAGETVGGMAGSFEVAGQRVDYGSHRLHPATPEPFLELFRSLLGPDLQVRPRHGRIRLHGRWIAFPLRAGDMVRNLPPSFGSPSCTGRVHGSVAAPPESRARLVRGRRSPIGWGHPSPASSTRPTPASSTASMPIDSTASWSAGGSRPPVLATS